MRAFSTLLIVLGFYSVVANSQPPESEANHRGNPAGAEQARPAEEKPSVKPATSIDNIRSAYCSNPDRYIVINFGFVRKPSPYLPLQQIELQKDIQLHVQRSNGEPSREFNFKKDKAKIRYRQEGMEVELPVVFGDNSAFLSLDNAAEGSLKVYNTDRFARNREVMEFKCRFFDFELTAAKEPIAGTRAVDTKSMVPFPSLAQTVVFASDIDSADSLVCGDAENSVLFHLDDAQVERFRDQSIDVVQLRPGFNPRIRFSLKGQESALQRLEPFTRNFKNGLSSYVTKSGKTGIAITTRDHRTAEVYIVPNVDEPDSFLKLPCRFVQGSAMNSVYIRE